MRHSLDLRGRAPRAGAGRKATRSNLRMGEIIRPIVPCVPPEPAQAPFCKRQRGSDARVLREWYSGASFESTAEDRVKKGIILAIGTLAFLAGCKNQASTDNTPVPPKWQGAPYDLAFDTAPIKPNPSGITIPTIKYTANPDALVRRVSLVVRFDTTGAKTSGPVMDQMIMAPVDISGAEGALPADYMDAADQGLAHLIGAYGMKGKVKIRVLLAQSSISSEASDDEINSKRLSDWLPTELLVKKIR